MDDAPVLTSAAPAGTQVDVARLRELASVGAPESPSSPLAPFVHGRGLLLLPAQAERRWTVLAHVVAYTFAPGMNDDEASVNELLGQWFEGGSVDHAALRDGAGDGPDLI